MADEPLFDSMCCDHLHGCDQDERHFHSCCGHWHGRPTDEPLFTAHELVHAEFPDGSLTPACRCGWYSPTRSHADFERHLRKVQQ